MFNIVNKLILSALVLVFSVNAFADYQDFNEEAFKTAQQAEQVILLEFHAPWCPTCRSQTKAISKIEADEAFAAVKMFKVDYDNSDELKKKFSVNKQSTLILLQGEKELDRTMGVTAADELSKFIKQAIK
jgi:thioredoxin 1